MEDCAGGAEELDAGEDVDDGGEVETGPDPEGVGVGTPDGPRSEYGSQSGLGKARGNSDPDRESTDARSQVAGSAR